MYHHVKRRNYGLERKRHAKEKREKCKEVFSCCLLCFQLCRSVSSDLLSSIAARNFFCLSSKLYTSLYGAFAHVARAGRVALQSDTTDVGIEKFVLKTIPEV